MPDFGLNGKTALVTGASRGIGFVIAKTLAREGCRVTMVARSFEKLARAAARIGASARPIAADLSISSEVDGLFSSVELPDILVNNAGAIPSGSLDDIDDARFRAAWDLKVFGYIHMCRHAMKAMSARGSGVIINVIGAAGERPVPEYIAGSGGNASLMAMTRALGAQSLRHGVRVVGVNPGPILTERLKSILRARARRQLGDSLRWKECLDGRYPPGRPQDIAILVAFLASELSANITGTIVTSDGGASSR